MSPTIKHMRYIPDTISLVSFVLISFQHIWSLLHSPALMRHNADVIYSMPLPADHVSLCHTLLLRVLCLKT